MAATASTRFSWSRSATSPAALKKDLFALNAPKQKDDVLVYKNGVLYYDADGSGAKAGIAIASFSKSVKLSAAEFYVV